MRVVYEPENLIDAHLVKGVLELEGFPVHLRGEHLAGGIGELPAFGLFALCVPESCEVAARGVIEELLRERVCAAVVADDDVADGWSAVAV